MGELSPIKFPRSPEIKRLIKAAKDAGIQVDLLYRKAVLFKSIGFLLHFQAYIKIGINEYNLCQARLTSQDSLSRVKGEKCKG